MFGAYYVTGQWGKFIKKMLLNAFIYFFHHFFNPQKPHGKSRSLDYSNVLKRSYLISPVVNVEY